MNRKIRIELTQTECEQVMWAIGQMTEGNARDIDEMMLCGMTRKQALALVSAEQKLQSAAQRKPTSGHG